VDRPGVDGVFGELDWTLYGIEWAVYGGKGGILGTKSVLSKFLEARRVVLVNLLTSFTEAFYSSEKSGLNHNSPIKSR